MDNLIDEFLNKRIGEDNLRTLTSVSFRENSKISVNGKEYIDFSSNDYLGLSSHPEMIATGKETLEKFGSSSTGSRLLSGDSDLFHELEEHIAKFKNKEAGLIFNSGYQANVGIIGTLCEKGDVVFLDKLSHASIIDGVLLSGAKFLRFNHNNIEHLDNLLKKGRSKYRNALIVSESIFSMDGDKANLKELVNLPLIELLNRANNVRKDKCSNQIDLCNIMNAKSGLCSEDCKFCAQSSHYSTGASSFPLKKKEEMIEAAKKAKEIGAHRFDIVTSGNTLTPDDFETIVETISEITRNVGIKMCASLGRLTKEQLQKLKDADLTRYHHNIETSRNYYPNIVTTHNYDERIETIKSIKDAGLEACSGGIIGLGESWQDRIDMALELKKLNVDSVPLNVLVPIKGIPLEGSNNISPLDAIRTIAIFRIILEDKIIKVAAGRESILKDYQALAFMAGANGMLIGGYLTIKGREVEEDRKLVKEVEGM